MKFSNMRVPAGIVVFCTAAFVLTGCLWKDPVESFHGSLEKIVELEEPFKQEQGSLKSLEKAESKLYEEMIRLNMDDFDRIAALSDKALKTAGKREKHLNSEKESIDEAKQEFEANKASAEKIDDQKVRKKAENAASYMEKRYKAYDSLYGAYQNAIGLDKELYKLLKNKGLKLDDLEEQLKKINQSYDKVLKESKHFNEYTKDYNKARKDFYKAAGFEMKEG
ncbi:YkyA family protein [Bacillus licheniformis]|uniref:YkyA family protein n=2 Tax=Bacillus licheniformis TaxID=1402 RepID=A0A415J1Q0_BACLI|nr:MULTISPECIES: YkyA family protein [Bacillus]KUL16414.1 hypothetical protein LI6934_16020 [Bacillus licheniformis LMG 6934]MBJ7887236.1 YkyA family protein [Bacillaceae bacterium HSR45]MBY8346338.1 hypothetical protein [Bacillus sp. PCH94]MDP4081011.1 YkyA family protein [Bacillota bacterium]NBB42773.1 hypothetical protein [Bacillus sp. y1(2019)]